MFYVKIISRNNQSVRYYRNEKNPQTETDYTKNPGLGTKNSIVQVIDVEKKDIEDFWSINQRKNDKNPGNTSSGSAGNHH